MQLSRSDAVHYRLNSFDGEVAKFEVLEVCEIAIEPVCTVDLHLCSWPIVDEAQPPQLGSVLDC